jgi:hypothetical protein
MKLITLFSLLEIIACGAISVAFVGWQLALTIWGCHLGVFLLSKVLQTLVQHPE